MAILPLCNGIITCLAADTKPPSSGAGSYPNGTKLIETDSGREYKLVNGEWLNRDVAEFFGRNTRIGGFLGAGGSATPTYGAWDASVINVAVGSGLFSSAIIDSNGTRARGATSTTINSIWGGRVGVMTERDLNPWTLWKVTLVTAITQERMFCGYRTSTINPVSAADPLASQSGVGFWFDTGVHATNIAICQNDGSASSDITTIPNVGTMALNAINTYEIRAVNASSKFQYRVNGFPNGAWSDINTKIPAATTDLGWAWYVETLDTNSKTFDIYHVKTKWDAP